MGFNDTYPKIQIRVKQSELKKLKMLKEHGYSNREVLEIALNSECEKIITVISKKTREPIQFPRGILSKRKDY